MSEITTMSIVPVVRQLTMEKWSEAEKNRKKNVLTLVASCSGTYFYLLRIRSKTFHVIYTEKEGTFVVYHKEARTNHTLCFTGEDSNNTYLDFCSEKGVITPITLQNDMWKAN